MITNWHLTAGTSKIKAWLLLLLSHGQTVGISNATQDKIILKKTDYVKILELQSSQQWVEVGTPAPVQRRTARGVRRCLLRNAA